LEIAHRFFASSEYRELVTLPEERRREAFFRVWTRKEACIKAVGKGFSIEPSCFRVTLLPEQPARLLNADSSSLQKKAWSLIDIDCGTGYKAAMATAIPEIRMYSFVWSPQTLLLQEKSVFKRVKSLLPLMRTA
jgi:4'-phosphopantetheinyl transferase